MRVVSVYSDMVPYMARFLAWRSSFQTAQFSTNCQRYGKITPVRQPLLTPPGHFTHSPLGYDLKQLFIGAEGTLGIITGVSILTQASPQATNNVVLALPSFDNVLPLFKTVKRQLSEILSAFEFFDRQAYDLVTKHNQSRALSAEDVGDAQCFVLVETSGGKREHDEEVSQAQV